MIYPRLEVMPKSISVNGSVFIHLDWHIVSHYLMVIIHLDWHIVSHYLMVIIHLDWHIVLHYVMVIIDEIFGYENFRNEIVIKRGRRESLLYQFKSIDRMHVANDSILSFEIRRNEISASIC